jgi:hypothetical protein
VLDDGYGSSNSSPHSSGTVQVYPWLILVHVMVTVRMIHLL